MWVVLYWLILEWDTGMFVVKKVTLAPRVVKVKNDYNELYLIDVVEE